MSEKYYNADENAERINIPGTVTPFNWTYRVCTAMEDLLKDKDLIKKIKAIAAAHKAKKEDL